MTSYDFDPWAVIQGDDLEVVCSRTSGSLSYSNPLVEIRSGEGLIATSKAGVFNTDPLDGMPFQIEIDDNLSASTPTFTIKISDSVTSLMPVSINNPSTSTLIEIQMTIDGSLEKTIMRSMPFTVLSQVAIR